MYGLMNRRGRRRVLELRFRQMWAEAAVVWGRRRINRLQNRVGNITAAKWSFFGVGAAVVLCGPW